MAMKIYQNAKHLVIRDAGFTAHALCAPYDGGDRGELEIEIYRDGHRAVAADVCVHGGKLPVEARAGSMSLLHELLQRAFEKWQGVTLTFDCPDQRRARVYAKLLRRYGIAFKQWDRFFEIGA